MANKKVIELIMKAISPVVGRRVFHRFYELLNQFSLIGMNIGTGSQTEHSGEKYVLEYINKYFRLEDNTLIIFDVGANAGHYSNLVKEIFGPKSLIYAFEPSSKAFEKYLKNLVAKSGIKAYQIALGDENNQTVLFSNIPGSGIASVYKRRLDHFETYLNQIEDIEIRTLDSFCSENGIDHIHLLKLDVEGHEKKVLDGASNMIESNSIDFIQFEFGGCNIDSRTYFQDFYYLLNEKYNIFRILRDGLYQITRYKETYELFTTTNFLAQRRQ